MVVAIDGGMRRQILERCGNGTEGRYANRRWRRDVRAIAKRCIVINLIVGANRN